MSTMTFTIYAMVSLYGLLKFMDIYNFDHRVGHTRLAGLHVWLWTGQ